MQQDLRERWSLCDRGTVLMYCWVGRGRLHHSHLLRHLQEFAVRLLTESKCTRRTKLTLRQNTAGAFVTETECAQDRAIARANLDTQARTVTAQPACKTVAPTAFASSRTRVSALPVGSTPTARRLCACRHVETVVTVPLRTRARAPSGGKACRAGCPFVTRYVIVLRGGGASLTRAP